MIPATRFESQKLLSKPNEALFARLRWLVIVAFFSVPNILSAQDHTVLFSTGAPGVSKAITNWGMSVTWPNYDNMRRTLIFMGTNEVDFVHLPFLAN